MLDGALPEVKWVRCSKLSGMHQKVQMLHDPSYEVWWARDGSYVMSNGPYYWQRYCSTIDEAKQACVAHRILTGMAVLQGKSLQSFMEQRDIVFDGVGMDMWLRVVSTP